MLRGVLLRLQRKNKFGACEALSMVLKVLNAAETQPYTEQHMLPYEI